MVEISDIQDKDSFEAWLKHESPPREAQFALAHRAAMRVMPVWWDWVETDGIPKNRDLTPLAVLRSLIISGVASLRPTPEVFDAFSAEYDDPQPDFTASDAPDGPVAAFAGAAAFAAPAPGFAAAVAASAAPDASMALWAELQADCALIDDMAQLMHAPLWQGTANPINKEWQDIKSQYPKDGDHPWGFWLDWYQRALDGTENRWDLLEQIALTPNKDWELGARHIASLIRALEKDDRRSDLPLAASTVSPMAVAQAFRLHRTKILIHIDALADSIEKEIERVRGQNDLDPEDRDRQISFLRNMGGDLEKIHGKVSDMPTLDDATAQEVGTLLSLYGNKFNEWAKDHANTVVGNLCNTALVGLSCGFLTLCGAPGIIALPAAIAICGGKDLIEKFKSIRGSNSD